jgi:hypothetical protein
VALVTGVCCGILINLGDCHHLDGLEAADSIEAINWRL